MKSTTILISSLLLIIFSVQRTFCQQKYEKESRIKVEEVPTIAREFIDSLYVEKKVRWYSETGLESKSIEAKFKQHKKCFSIEFNTSGHIQDAEIEIYWIDISPLVKATISSQLGEMCTKYKTKKIQIQYSGNETDLLTYLKGVGTSEKVITRYELVVKCMNKGSTNLFEYLFNEKGELLETSKIVFKNSSNLEY